MINAVEYKIKNEELMERYESSVRDWLNREAYSEELKSVVKSI